MLYSNLTSGLIPQFAPTQVYGSPKGKEIIFFSDLDGDKDLDYLIKTKSSDYLAYAVNMGDNQNPNYKVVNAPLQFEQCNNSFHKIAPIPFRILDITLVDIDGDDDLDLFSLIQIDGSRILAYCENQGSATNPFFVAAVKNPFGLLGRSSVIRPQKIYFADIDGDGDQDSWIGSVFYDNIGNPKEALFRHISHITFSLTLNTPQGSSFVDTDRDGQVDSFLVGKNGFGDGELRLLYKALEPATNIAATVLNLYSSKSIILATNRSSQVQLQMCNIYGACFKTLLLANTAQELSLSTGDFDGDGHDDIVLAMIDADGLLKVKIFDSELRQIGNGEGGLAHSISISTGQLDSDKADEYVVSLVRPNNQVEAFVFNFDGSQVGKAQIGQGKQPSIATGQFSESGDSYVVAYLSLDNQVKTATFHSDGTLIGRGNGDSARYVKVSKADFLPTPKNDYVVSLIKTNGTAELIGFSFDGKQLGNKVMDGLSQQATVASGTFPGVNDKGLAVSLIQANKKPAIIFLDNQGNYIATGVGATTASTATSVLIDDYNDDGIDEGLLIYIDEAGIPRGETFGADGIKK